MTKCSRVRDTTRRCLVVLFITRCISYHRNAALIFSKASLQGFRLNSDVALVLANARNTKADPVGYFRLSLRHAKPSVFFHCLQFETFYAHAGIVIARRHVISSDLFLYARRRYIISQILLPREVSFILRTIFVYIFCHPCGHKRTQHVMARTRRSVTVDSLNSC